MTVSERTITVELRDGHKFEVGLEERGDAGTEAQNLLRGDFVTEKRGSDNSTIYPMRRVKAIHLGDIHSEQAVRMATLSI